METLRKYTNIACVAALLLLAGSMLPKGCDWTPSPVVPVVPVNPPPFKTDKLCVLIIEETAQRGSLSPGQRAAILSTAPGSLIQTVMSGGGEIRIFDKDQQNVSSDNPWVKDALAVPHPEVPWIIAAGPKSGFSRKLPDTVAETLKLLEGVK